MFDKARVKIGAFVVGALSLVLLCPSALALDPSLDVSQYAHTAWTVREGFTQGYIRSIAQTPDGYIWLGTGFGLAQNASLTLMFERVTAEGYDMVSALWNLAYDAGMGVGAAGFGVLVTRSGYPAGFALVGALMLGALTPIWLERGWMRGGARAAGG